MVTTEFRDLLVGFDHIFKDMLNTSVENYPPFNIINVKDGEKYRIELAIAGFSKKELQVELKENTLSVRGIKQDNTKDPNRYMYRGLAKRNFIRRFALMPHIEVTSVKMEEGILNIELKYELPEEKKPKILEVT